MGLPLYLQCESMPSDDFTKYIDTRFHHLDEAIESLDTRLQKLDASLDHFSTTLTTSQGDYEKRLSALEVERIKAEAVSSYQDLLHSREAKRRTKDYILFSGVMAIVVVVVNVILKLL